MERCPDFLLEKNPMPAGRAAEPIERQLQMLVAHPETGRPHAELPELRELLIPFADTGYIALYRYIEAEETAVMLAFRHQKEAGC
jgi:plasmid stabilization system protein ParE